MGLFMSIEPCDDFPCGGYLSCTPPVPFIYNLILLDSCDCEITRIAIKKHWMHPALERTEIEADGFCGTLFKPPGERRKGPFPAVIDISGTGGGLHEHKGSMLASEGFVVLCVAFFQYKNLVKKLSDVEIEYFEINAVVSINGPHVQNSFINIKEYGELLPQPRTDPKLGYFINGLMVSSPVLRHIELDESVEIPWRRIPASTSFRLVASIDDLVAPSVFCCRYVSQRLIEGGHNFEACWSASREMQGLG
ncbi:BAAT/acyl-CoA thioester hydrolase protein, partial [Necator americanus]